MVDDERERDADLVTPCITGTSPGSRIEKDTPEYVVPTSNARISFRKAPVYGLRADMTGSCMEELGLTIDFN